MPITIDTIRHVEGDDSWAMIVCHNGEFVRMENDYMEPEDASFVRDLDWIPDAIQQAYLLGREDERNEATRPLEGI